MSVPAGTVSVVAHDAGTSPAQQRALRDRAEAEAYVAGVCFKHGPPRLAGVELEWLVGSCSAPDAPPDPSVLAAALGPHAPTTLVASSPNVPLPHGSTVTVEPGGQVELASPPLPDLSALLQATAADAAELHRRLSAHGLVVEHRAADPRRPPTRILDVPRYAAMERAFDRFGPYGRSGMCSTSAVQVCVDAGTAAQLPLRWAAVHALGPVLLGAFANSPVLHGRRTGWKSSRAACWLAADPARTAPPDDPLGSDPAGSWARRVLDTPLLCVRRRHAAWDAPPGVTFADWIDGALLTRPSTADLDYHVSTMFPPVRARGHLEIRYVDAQPGEQWALPTAVLVALLSDPGVTEQALAASEPASDRWIGAARHGLGDPVLAAAAARVFTLACGALRALDAPAALLAELEAVTEHRVLRGRCPADGPLPGEPTVPADPAGETDFAALMGQPATAGAPEHLPEGDRS